MNAPIVINLIGGPGSGKSTTAAGLFYALKQKGINVEMALEFAKDKVWEEAFRTMDDQIYIFAKQYHKIWRLRDKVDVIITDSPLPISIYYNKEKSDYFNDFVIEQYNKFTNLMFFIERGEHYQTEGRIQTKEESIEIDKQIKSIMIDNHIDFKSVRCEDAVDSIIKEVKMLLCFISFKNKKNVNNNNVIIDHVSHIKTDNNIDSDAVKFTEEEFKKIAEICKDYKINFL